MEFWQFWVAATVMALSVLAVLIQALRREPGADTANADLQVYRDQLREVDRDLARGVLSAADAERVRSEVSRRLLEADRRGAADVTPERTRGTLPAMALIGVILAAMGWLYFDIGAPGYPDLALKSRLAATEEIYRTRPAQAAAEAQVPAQSFSEDPALLAKAQALREAAIAKPDDPETLANLALTEASLGDMVAARTAQARLITLRGAAASANDHAALGWMLIAAAGGYVSPQAEAELVAALKLDPRNSLARYYSGLMFAQVGRPDRAFALWEPLLQEGPETAPWIAPIRLGIADLAARAGIRYDAAAAAGPGPEDIAAADELSPEDRKAMIETMVQRLADRLGSEGGPPQDWARLITSLATLGRTTEATAILDEAKTRFADQAQALALVMAAADQAGLK